MPCEEVSSKMNRMILLNVIKERNFNSVTTLRGSRRLLAQTLARDSYKFKCTQLIEQTLPNVNDPFDLIKSMRQNHQHGSQYVGTMG